MNLSKITKGNRDGGMIEAIEHGQTRNERPIKNSNLVMHVKYYERDIHVRQCEPCPVYIRFAFGNAICLQPMGSGKRSKSHFVKE